MHVVCAGVQFDISPIDQTVQEGDDININCRLTGQQQYTVQWAKVRRATLSAHP